MSHGRLVSAGSGAIGGRAFYDLDDDGMRDDPVDDAINGIPGIAVTLHRCDGEALASMETRADGRYRFGHLAPGGYYLATGTAPAGYELSATWVATGGDGVRAEPRRRPSPRAPSAPPPPSRRRRRRRRELGTGGVVNAAETNTFDPDAGRTVICIQLREGEQTMAWGLGFRESAPACRDDPDFVYASPSTASPETCRSHLSAADGEGFSLAWLYERCHQPSGRTNVTGAALPLHHFCRRSCHLCGDEGSPAPPQPVTTSATTVATTVAATAPTVTTTAVTSATTTSASTQVIPPTASPEASPAADPGVDAPTSAPPSIPRPPTYTPTGFPSGADNEGPVAPASTAPSLAAAAATGVGPPSGTRPTYAPTSFPTGANGDGTAAPAASLGGALSWQPSAAPSLSQSTLPTSTPDVQLVSSNSDVNPLLGAEGSDVDNTALPTYLVVVSAVLAGLLLAAASFIVYRQRKGSCEGSGLDGPPTLPPSAIGVGPFEMSQAAASSVSESEASGRLKDGPPTMHPGSNENVGDLSSNSLAMSEFGTSTVQRDVSWTTPASSDQNVGGSNNDPGHPGYPQSSLESSSLRDEVSSMSDGSSYPCQVDRLLYKSSGTRADARELVAADVRDRGTVAPLGLLPAYPSASPVDAGMRLERLERELCSLSDDLRDHPEWLELRDRLERAAEDLRGTAEPHIEIEVLLPSPAAAEISRRLERRERAVRSLFEAFRNFPKDTPPWLALRSRLQRAAEDLEALCSVGERRGCDATHGGHHCGHTNDDTQESQAHYHQGHTDYDTDQGEQMPHAYQTCIGAPGTSDGTDSNSPLGQGEQGEELVCGMELFVDGAPHRCFYTGQVDAEFRLPHGLGTLSRFSLDWGARGTTLEGEWKLGALVGTTVRATHLPMAVAASKQRSTLAYPGSKAVYGDRERSSTITRDNDLFDPDGDPDDLNYIPNPYLEGSRREIDGINHVIDGGDIASAAFDDADRRAGDDATECNIKQIKRRHSSPWPVGGTSDGNTNHLNSSIHSSTSFVPHPNIDNIFEDMIGRFKDCEDFPP